MDLGKFYEKRFRNRNAVRRGRGSGSGLGGTAGRGHKGQKARAGCSLPRGFEGGQMPLSRRIPKWGFTNIFKERYAVLNVQDLNGFKSGAVVDLAAVAERRHLPKSLKKLKILANGELKVKLTVKAHKFSRAAVEKIQAAGGTAETLD